MLFTLSRAYAPLMPSAVVLSSSLPSFSNFSLINFILRLYRCNFKILICYNAFMKTFINRMKELRTNRNLTQKELAAMLKICRNTVSNWENGKQLPKLHQVIALAKLYNVKCNYLLGLED